MKTFSYLSTEIPPTMKNILTATFTILAATMLAGTAAAQGDPASSNAASGNSGGKAAKSDKPVSSRPPKTYLDFGCVFQQANFADATIAAQAGGKADFGLGLDAGTTYFINPNSPILSMIRLGIDYSYFDLTYAAFSGRNASNETVKHHFIQWGMAVGASVTVTPIKHLNAKTYVRYLPTLSTYFASNGDFTFINYAGYVAWGLQASYSLLTLGVEMRWSSVNFASIAPKLGSNLGGVNIWGEKQRAKLPSTRIIVGLRF